MRSVLPLLVRGLLGVAIGCAGSAPRGAEPAPAPPANSAWAPSASVSVDAGTTTAPGPVSDASPEPEPADGGPSAVVDASGGPRACPSGMQLVDGDYCTKVEQKCLSSWFDKSNKKTVCEKFEPRSRCVGERVHTRFCMDTYEWPNRAGKRPEVMNIFYQAELNCAAVGKRLCTESEWTMACEGPKLLPFPYGYERDTAKCNGDRMWDEPNMDLVRKRDAHELGRLWQGVPSGSQPDCVSAYGVADLPGNTDEVVSSETFSQDFRGKYDSVHTGGPWYKGVRNQCRPKIYTHDEGFYYYFLSFRCCAEADGKPTDFRTARQRKEQWKLGQLERKAGWTLGEVKEKLGKKAAGESCGCDELKGEQRRIKCRTICGQLLGPNAKDAVRGRPELALRVDLASSLAAARRGGRLAVQADGS